MMTPGKLHKVVLQSASFSQLVEHFLADMQGEEVRSHEAYELAGDICEQAQLLTEEVDDKAKEAIFSCVKIAAYAKVIAERLGVSEG